MKRGAERQLTKDGPDNDDGDDDEIEEIQDPQGFQKADESALARRQIRALPKRALAAPKPPALNGLPPAPASDVDKVETAPSPKFGGFAGFGAGTSVSNPFTFTAQPSSASAFASSSLQSTPTLNPPFGSPFLGAPNQSFSDSDTPPPKPGMSPPSEQTDAVALKYFKSLRGLNVSFLSTISTAVEKDPFFDVASLVDSYKNLRTTIQSEFDGSSQSFMTRAPVTTNSAPLFGAKAPSEKITSLFSMPKPSIGSTEASFKPPLTSESGAKTGGYTLPPFVPPSSSTPTQLPFGFAPKPTESSIPSPITFPEPSNSAFKFPASGTPASTSGLQLTSCVAFAIPSGIETVTSMSASGSSSQEPGGSSVSSSLQPASIAPSFGSTSMPNLFATAKPTSASATSDAASKPTSVFGSSVFGSSSTTESRKPSPFNPSPFDNKESSKVTATLFGSATTTTTSSTSTSIFGSSSDKPVSFFGSASQPKTSAFAFGKPGGSIGNPVGFGFGSSSPSTGDGPSSSGFSFGAPSTKPSESLFSPPMTDRSSESTPQPEAEGNEEAGEEDAVKLLPSHTHDEEGEGEEDEETTHVVKCKVFRLTKSENKSEWKDLGIGMFRLKKHKETNVRRVLMRNSSTGRILINFRIYAGLKPSLTKAVMSFIGYENSTPTSFRIRVKTEEQAEELKQALEREVTTIQAVK